MSIKDLDAQADRDDDFKRDEMSKPPLPEAAMTEMNPYRDMGALDPHKGKEVLEWFTAEQMYEYARAAIAASGNDPERSVE